MHALKSRKEKEPQRRRNPPVYKMIALVCGLLLFSTAASAQRLNAFVGYSYSSFGFYPPQGYSLLAGSPAIIHRLNGWNASLEAKVFPFFGIVADFSGYHGNETVAILCSPATAGPPYICTTAELSTTIGPGASYGNVSLYTFTFGPQVSLPLGRFRPYAHALFGGAHYRGVSPGFLLSDTSFADLLGGGIDVSLISRLAWRVQADALQTRFPFGDLGSKQNSLRLSTGLVVRF